jgi:L-alanine-DL-glutamate epimerase-like enolase superfamily enzyme
MKITEVEGIALSLRSQREIADGTQDAFLIRVHTDAGVTGIGEADTSPLVAQAILDAPVSGDKCQGLRHVLIGQDPLDRERLWARMYYRTYKYGRKGAALNVMSGIDIALWDIFGKVAGQPLYQLLGGAIRKEIPAYASTLFPEDADDLDDIRTKARRAHDQGFRAIKFGWGGFGHDAEHDARMVERARETMGPEMELMIDVGMRWDAPTAIERVNRLRDWRPYFIEEPVSADDLEGYRRIAEAIAFTRIVGGEQEYCRWGFQLLLDHGRVHGIQPDLARSGGITECRKVAALAQARGVPVIPHGWSTNVLVAANLHFIAATPNAPWLEYCVADSPLRWEVTSEKLPMEGGIVRVPEGPGLGVTLDERTIAKYRV